MSAERTVEDIKRNETSQEVRTVLNALGPYIPSSDLPILRAALYLRQKFRQGETLKVQSMKDDIVKKYGDRGAKIANLCSAKYFEELIIPLLEGMRSDPNFTKEAFQKSYEIIIAESGFALFVRSTMSRDQIKRLALEKIRTNARYGQKHLHIHGIGKANVENIREVANQLLKDLPGLEKPVDNNIGNVAYVELRFGPELIQSLAASSEN